MKKETIFIALIILISALIISSAYLVSQINKQRSIERQQQMKINQEEKIIKEKQEEERYNQFMYNGCVREAKDEYWSYMELNGTEKDDGSIRAKNYIWDRAEERKQQDIENCQQQYLED